MAMVKIRVKGRSRGMVKVWAWAQQVEHGYGCTCFLSVSEGPFAFLKRTLNESLHLVFVFVYQCRPIIL